MLGENIASVEPLEGNQQEQGLSQGTSEELTPDSLMGTPEVKVETLQGPQPYTDDEFDALPDMIAADESRLTPAQKKYWLKAKNLESGYTKKFQEVAEIRKSVEQAKQHAELEADPRVKFQRQFEQNPDYFIEQKKREIRDLLSRDDVFEAQKKQVELDDLRDAKDRLRDMQYRSFMSNFMLESEMQKKIPDYTGDLKDAVTKYALEEEGIPNAELEYHSNIRMHGQAAIDYTKRIVDRYKKSLALRSKVSSAVKEPSKVEPAGSGFEPAKKDKWTPEDSFNTIEKFKVY